MGLPDNAIRLLQQGADVNAKGGLASTALVTGASGGHCDVLELLLNKGAEVSTPKLSVITNVIGKNGPGALELLLSHEPTIKVDDLVKAAVFNYNATPELVEVLFKHAKNFTISQDTWEAAECRCDEMST